MIFQYKSQLVGVVLVAALVWGCDSDNVGTPDAGGQPDAAGQQDGAPQPDSSVDSDGAVPDSGVDPDGAQPDASTGHDGGSGDLVVTFASASLGANCMPAIPPDPWNGTLDLLFDNSAAATPASATVLGVRMIFQVTGNPTLDLTVTPTAVGPIGAGATQTVTFTKTGSTPDLPGDCGYCNGQVIYSVSLDVGGQVLQVDSPPQNVSCAH